MSAQTHYLGRRPTFDDWYESLPTIDEVAITLEQFDGRPPVGMAHHVRPLDQALAAAGQPNRFRPSDVVHAETRRVYP